LFGIAAAVDGLTVPVEVRIETEAFLRAAISDDPRGLEVQLVENARAAAATPGHAARTA